MSAPVDPLALVVAGLAAVCKDHAVAPDLVHDLEVWAVVDNLGPLALCSIAVFFDPAVAP